jgi:starch synthase
LHSRRDRLAGITNGVDFDIWNPETDKHIAANYSVDDLSGKQECKLDLLRRFGLPEEANRPIIAIISRLFVQKGYDLIRQLAGASVQTGAFFIALGAGAKEYEDFLQSWHDSAPRQVGIYRGYAGEPLAHQIEAGADMFLMPSLYEPCGLNQMYSMRYGTVPIVRATGGLDDTVQQYDAGSGVGTGFKFQPYDASALLEKIREALYFYGRPKTGPRFSAMVCESIIHGPLRRRSMCNSTRSENVLMFDDRTRSERFTQRAGCRPQFQPCMLVLFHSNEAGTQTSNLQAAFL